MLYHTENMITATTSLTPDKNTANVRSTATFLDRACRVWGVNEFIKPIRDHLRVKGTEFQQDANNLSALVRTNAILLLHLYRCAEDSDYAYNFLVVTSTDRIEPQIHTLSNINRLSFAAMGNFFLESMLRDLVSDFHETPKRNFHELCTQVVHLAQLDNEKEHTDALRVISKLRNTFHNRGIHNGYKGADESITVKGVRYDFVHNDIVKGQASWDYISHGLACALMTILELLNRSRP